MKTQARRDWSVLCVLNAIADRIGADPSELDTPLYDVVDPDALERLVDSTAGLTITFEYEGQTVSVSSGGSVEVVCEPERRGEAA